MATLETIPTATGSRLYYINQILDRNQRISWLAISMILAIFVLCLSLLIVGLVTKDWRILTSFSGVLALLCWSINRILRMRIENIILLSIALIPVEALPPEKAAEQLQKMIDKMLEYDQKTIRNNRRSKSG